MNISHKTGTQHDITGGQPSMGSQQYKQTGCQNHGQDQASEEAANGSGSQTEMMSPRKGSGARKTHF